MTAEITRRTFIRNSSLIVAFTALPIGAASAARLIEVRMWPAEEYTRLTIEHDVPIKFRYFVMRKLSPVRMAVDIEGMVLSERLQKMIEGVKANDPYIAGIKVEQNTKTTIRISIDFKVDVDPQVFSLKPVGNYKYRLVFDIYPAEQRDPLMAIIQKQEKEKDAVGRLLAQVAEGQKRMKEIRAEAGGGDAIGDIIAGISSGTAVPMRPEGQAGQKTKPVKETPKKAGTPAKAAEKLPPKTAPAAAPAETKKPSVPQRQLVIAIDPGHGGEDPGAIGKTYGTREKDVVLSVGRILYRELNALPGIKAVMTRNSDYFVPLNRRVSKARAANADFFVSIHADAWIKTTVRGSSVFCLNNKGKVSTQNKWLANNQNNADLIGGVNITSQDESVAKILMDMSFTAQISDSRDYGSKILAELEKINALHRSYVEEANFAVLKAPDIPSVLVETAFLSNPEEEKKLRSSAFQRKLAVAIGNGILRAFNRKVRLA
jgi:N-acetylmuramoyl-L-alanine amidase